MKNNKIFIALCFSAIAFCACETDNREDMTASLEYREIKVDKDKLSFEANSINSLYNSDRELTITATNASWSVESPDEWIHMDTEKGDNTATIKVTADKYTNPDAERNGMIIVKSAVTGWDFADTVYVNQRAADRYVEAAEAEYEISAKGGELIIPVDANCEWDASVLDGWATWATVEKISQTQLKATIEPTTSVNSRSVTIWLGASSSSSTYSKFIIKQAAPSIEVEQTVYEVPAKGGELIIPVEADVEWKIYRSQDWVSYEKISNKQLKVNVKETTSSSNREATLEFRLENSTSTVALKTITIKQEKPIIRAEKKSYDMPAKGGMILVNIEADVNWVVAASYTYDWITFEHYSDTQVAVIADPTTATGTRTAYFDLKLPGTTYKMDSFSVTQEAGTISVSETDFKLTKDAQSVEVIVEANTDWNVEVQNPTMVSVSQTKGEAGRTKLTINIEKTSTYRSSKVYLRIGKNRVREINISQQ